MMWPPVLLKTIVLFIILVAVILLVFHGRKESQNTPYIRDGLVQFDTARAYWEEEIKNKGALYAANEFQGVGNTLRPQESHLLAHAFGGALYESEGIDGFSFCPDVFSWGCAHQFIGEAIVGEGLSTISKIFSACDTEVTKKRSCMHSIGHGLVGYFGYDEPSLNDALSLCYAYSTSTHGGCLAGTFMEYNLRFLALLDATGTLDVLRPVDEQRMYDPCLTVDARFRPACAFELPRWWYNAAGADTNFERAVGELSVRCSGLPDGRGRRFCFEGLGALAAVSTAVHIDPERAIAVCTGLERLDVEKLYCTVGIVLHMHYWDMPGYADICRRSGLSGSHLEYCKLYAATEVEETSALPPAPL